MKRTLLGIGIGASLCYVALSRPEIVEKIHQQSSGNNQKESTIKTFSLEKITTAEAEQIDGLRHRMKWKNHPAYSDLPRATAFDFSKETNSAYVVSDSSLFFWRNGTTEKVNAVQKMYGTPYLDPDKPVPPYYPWIRWCLQMSQVNDKVAFIEPAQKIPPFPLYLYDQGTKTKKRIGDLQSEEGFAISHGGRYIAYATPDSSVVLYDDSTGIKRILMGKSDIARPQFTRDSLLIRGLRTDFILRFGE